MRENPKKTASAWNPSNSGDEQKSFYAEKVNMAPWRRQTKDLPLKKQIYITTEGIVTEIEYLQKLQPFLRPDVRITIIKRLEKEKGCSSPDQVMEKMEQHQRERHLRLTKDDEQWLIFDVDSWTDEQFEKCKHWAKKRRGNHLAVSNPCFEYWLLLHFTNPHKELSQLRLLFALGEHIPHYKKHLDRFTATSDNLKAAHDRAKKRHESEIQKIQNDNVEKYKELLKNQSDNAAEAVSFARPLTNGSTMYLLIEHICDLENFVEAAENAEYLDSGALLVNSMISDPIPKNLE